MRLYAETFYKTLPGCTRDPARCHAFERAAEELLENSVTDEVKRKVDGNKEMEEAAPSSTGDDEREQVALSSGLQEMRRRRRRRRCFSLLFFI